MSVGALELGPVRVDPLRRLATTPRGEHRLSQLEVDLLSFLAERAGRDVSREELLTRVWGHRRVSETRAVDMAVLRLRKKLEPDPANPQMILSTRGDGYRLVLLPDEPVLAPQPVARAPAAPSTAPLTPPGPRSNLVRPAGALFGADELIARVAEELAAGERVLCLEGSPGVGKTRLARELGLRELHSGRWQEVWLVELAGARGLEGLCLATAEALDLDTGAQPDVYSALHGIGHALAARRDVLLILDRAEHLRDPVAEALRVWCHRARRLSVIVTTQARLHLGEERSFVVPPLEPDSGLALFQDRARRAGAPAPAPEDDGILREIVRLLDGLPLSIELAAARARGLSPTELLTRLTRGQASLGPGGTIYGLREALSWSWSLLSEPEQGALQALSVFEGDFSREAALAVIGEHGEEFLETLLDRSLLVRQPDRPGKAARFTLLRALRRFAARRIEPAGSAEARRRHAAFFVRLSAELLRERGRPGARAALESIAEEAGNLRVAADWLAREPGPGASHLHLALAELHGVHGAENLRLAALNLAILASEDDPMARAEALRSRAATFVQAMTPREASADVEAALALLPPTPSRLRAELYRHRADIGRLTSNLLEHVRWLSRAAEEAEEAGEQLLALSLRSARAQAGRILGEDGPGAVDQHALHREAYERCRAAGRLDLAWGAVGSLIGSLDASGDFAESLRLRQQASADAERYRLPGWEDYWAIQLGMGLLRAHDFEGAVAAFERSTLLSVVRGARARLLYAHTYLATALIHLRRFEDARRPLLRLRELAMIPGNERWMVGVTEGMVQIALDQGAADQAAALVFGDTALLPAVPSPVERSYHQLFVGMTEGLLGHWEHAEHALSRVTVPPLSPELRLAILFWSCAAALALDDASAQAERRSRLEAALAGMTLPDQASWRSLLEILEAADAAEALEIADGRLHLEGRHSSHYLRLAARGVWAATRGL